MKRLILGSASPRRKQLLSSMGLSFEVKAINCDESHPSHLEGEDIARHIALKKAEAASFLLTNDEILITADTVVWKNGRHLAKAQDEHEALEMLNFLSGGCHEVITACALKTLNNTVIISAVTEVQFAVLSPEDISHYIRHFQPFDKAGAYGIQEWIGLIGIERINGCYNNVVGLPTQKLYATLKTML